MSMRVLLSGRLMCSDAAEAELVGAHLPHHVRLTRAEPGCIRFEVRSTDDPLVWTVDEEFAGESAFRAHQERVAASEWGRATAGIRREYEIERQQG